MKTQRLLYDPKLRRPGCVLLQAAMGCDHHLLGRLFPAETWLAYPTPDMGCYEADPWQLIALAEMSKEAVGV